MKRITKSGVSVVIEDVVTGNKKWRYNRCSKDISRGKIARMAGVYIIWGYIGWGRELENWRIEGGN